MIAETRKLYAHENTFLNDINHMEYALDPKKTWPLIGFTVIPLIKN
jgi:hypothetical protein